MKSSEVERTARAAYDKRLVQQGRPESCQFAGSSMVLVTSPTPALWPDRSALTTWAMCWCDYAAL